MADDNPQRPFRHDLQSRTTASNASGGSNDPLAELARLIGQSDPFGEYGREGARQPPTPQSVSEAEPMLRALAAQVPPRQSYSPQPSAPVPPPHLDEFARQPFGSAPLAGSGDVYQTHEPMPGYEAHAGTAGYGDAGYDPNMAPYAGDEQDYYDDVPPPRRRMGVLAIAAVFALAVVGTAGAFGYRALFGSAGSGPPPVIKADSKPVKIVPEKDKDQSAKLINDRINERGGDQKLVSREEQPVDLNKDKPAAMPAQDQAAGGAAQMPPIGSGVIGSDPKKIHTITIRPDQSAAADASAGAAPLQANVTDAMPTQPAPAPEPNAVPPAARAASAPPPVPAAKPAARPAPRQAETHRPAPAAHQVAGASNAPLSLSPDAAPVRPAAVAPRAPAPTRLAPAASSGYAVQVSSRRSQADAQAALDRVKSQFGSVIGGQQVMVRRVDLGAKGVYYRAMVGPFGSSEEASKMCGRLKAAGGSCFVQRI